MKQAPMRGVFERPAGSGVFWINYYDAAGRRHRERIGRESVAVEAYLQRRQEIREGKFTPPRSAGGLSFRELADLAIESKKIRNKALSIRQDEYLLGRLAPELGDRPAGKIGAVEISDVLKKFHAEGLGGSALNRYRSFVSSVFSFAVRERRLVENPCRRVPRFPENESRDRFLREDEEARLRLVIRKRRPQAEAELDLALHTGIRRGEQFLLERGDVDLERALLTVRVGKTGRRYIPLNDAAIAALEKLLSRSSGVYVVDRRSPGRRDWRRWFEDCVEEAGVRDFTWHDLRHTFASRLVAAGVPLAAVQELLGHKSILQTRRYAHLAPAHLRSAVEILAPAPEKKSGRLRVIRGRKGA